MTNMNKAPEMLCAQLEKIWDDSSCPSIVKYRDSCSLFTLLSGDRPGVHRVTFHMFSQMILKWSESGTTDGNEKLPLYVDDNDMQNMMVGLNHDINLAIFSQDNKRSQRYCLLFKMTDSVHKPLHMFVSYIDIVRETFSKAAEVVQFHYINNIIKKFRSKEEKYDLLFEFQSFFESYGNVSEQEYWANFEAHLNRTLTSKSDAGTSQKNTLLNHLGIY
jgi:hypothetical protein